MIVRELVAVMGLQYDEASFKRAESGIEKVKRGAQALGTIFATGIVARGLNSFVQRASDVVEAENLIDQSFDESAAAVRRWSRSTAKEVGRSEFTLRKFAGQMGAMLNPMLEGNAEKAAEFSMTLSRLAVDLSSFFNTSEREAIRALQSGLAGEVEPLRRRFGVTLTQAALEEFARSQGVQQSIKDMNEAQKTELRYQFILARTTNAQGDAVRTANEYANASRALSDRLGDLATRIGLKLLPGATRMVRVARDLLNRFLELAEGTRIIETALSVLGVVATVVAAKMLLPFIPALLMAAAVAAALGGIIVVAEDLWAFFEGRVSVIGGILRDIGVDADQLRRIFSKLGEVASRVWDAISRSIAELVNIAFPSMDGALTDLGDAFNRFLDWVEPKLDALLDMDIEEKKKAVADFFQAFKDKLSAFVNSPVGKILLTMLGIWVGKKLGEALGSAGGKMLGGIVGELTGGRKGSPLGKISGMIAENAAGLGGGALGSLMGFMAARDLLDPNRAKGIQNLREVAPSTIPMSSTSTTNRTLNVTVEGSASPEQKEEFRQIVREEQEGQLREAKAHVPRTRSRL